MQAYLLRFRCHYPIELPVQVLGMASFYRLMLLKILFYHSKPISNRKPIIIKDVTDLSLHSGMLSPRLSHLLVPRTCCTRILSTANANGTFALFVSFILLYSILYNLSDLSSFRFGLKTYVIRFISTIIQAYIPLHSVVCNFILKLCIHSLLYMYIYNVGLRSIPFYFIYTAQLESILFYLTLFHAFTVWCIRVLFQILIVLSHCNRFFYILLCFSL